jgi:hypothetical protein
MGTTQLDVLKNAFVDSINQTWVGIFSFIPKLLLAVVVMLIGWIIAVTLGKVAWHIIKAIQLDRALESVSFKRVWERSGYKLNTPLFFYELVKWFVIIVFLTLATNILGLTQITDLLKDVVNYLPNVIVAAVVLVIGVLVSKLVEGVITASVKTANLNSHPVLAKIAKWAILVFALLIALDKLGVATYVVQTAETGLIFATALALGLAFGLGGRDYAKEVIGNVSKDMHE